MYTALKQLGANSTKVTIGELTILFSYETAVAFTMPLMNWVVDPKKYSRTTSRHIKVVIPSDQQIRAASHDSFLEALERAKGGYPPRAVLMDALGYDYYERAREVAAERHAAVEAFDEEFLPRASK